MKLRYLKLLSLGAILAISVNATPLSATDASSIQEMKELMTKLQQNTQSLWSLLDEFSRDPKKIDPAFSCASFSAKCEKTKNHLVDTIITPLKQRLEEVKATAPNSNYHKILEKAHELLLDVHTMIEKLYGVWQAHLTKTVKDTAAFSGDLQAAFGPLEKLDLEKRVKELEELIKAENDATISAELARLQALITTMGKELKDRFTNKIARYNAWKKMWAKP